MSASEFLEMAARLGIYENESPSLPKHEEAEALNVKNSPGSCWNTRSAKRLRRELAERFSTISMCGSRPKSSRIKRYKRHHASSGSSEQRISNCGGAWKARCTALRREVFSGIVTHRIVSVASQIVYVLRRLVESESGGV